MGKGKEVKCAAGAYAQLVTNAPIIQYKLYTLLAWYMPVHHHMYKPKLGFFPGFPRSLVHFNSQFVYYSITELYTLLHDLQ